MLSINGLFYLYFFEWLLSNSSCLYLFRNQGSATAAGSGHSAQQRPLFDGGSWWMQAEDQEAAFGPSGGASGKHDAL